MRFIPAKGSAIVDPIDAAEPVAGGSGSGSVAVIDSPGDMPHRRPVGIENTPQPQDTTAKRLREQLNGICALRSAAINAALNVKGSFGEGFEAFMGDLLKRKPELALGFLKPMMMLGTESAGGAAVERAPILIIQSQGAVAVNVAERAA